MYDFSVAYRDAARTLAGGQDTGDVRSIPVVPLYRHAVETLIKSILVDASTELPWIRAAEVFRRLHKLNKQLPDLTRVAREYQCELSPQFVALITAWHEQDLSGMKARYPVNIAGKYEPLDGSDRFDLKAFVADCELALNELDEIFRLVSDSVYRGILCGERLAPAPDE